MSFEVYVSKCPHDQDFFCDTYCKTLQDKPWWCTHREDLYKKALELEEKNNSDIENIITQ